MVTVKPYKKRPVRFLEIVECNNWKIKLYSISSKHNLVDSRTIEYAKEQLPKWLEKTEIYRLETYKVATLILHEGKEGCFAIISWWIYENMMQLFVYLATDDNPTAFKLYSDKGIVTCVWEMAVLWFERNAWVEYVLKQPENPDAISHYLNQQLNEDV